MPIEISLRIFTEHEMNFTIMSLGLWVMYYFFSFV